MGTSSMVCYRRRQPFWSSIRGHAGFVVGWENYKYPDWPQSTGGIAVDSKGNVWIAAFGLVPAPAGRGRGRGADRRAGRGHATGGPRNSSADRSGGG
jgi:hypothetical protein